MKPHFGRKRQSSTSWKSSTPNNSLTSMQLWPRRARKNPPTLGDVDLPRRRKTSDHEGDSLGKDDGRRMSELMVQEPAETLGKIRCYSARSLLCCAIWKTLAGNVFRHAENLECDQYIMSKISCCKSRSHISKKGSQSHASCAEQTSPTSRVK